MCNGPADGDVQEMEQELNAGCVNFLELPAVSKQAMAAASVSDSAGVSASAKRHLSSALSHSGQLQDCMDNILSLQLSLLAHMLCTVASNPSGQASPLSGKVMNGNTSLRSLVCTFYGRSWVV